MDAQLFNQLVQERHEDVVTNSEAESTYNDAQPQLQTLPDLCLLKIFSDKSLDLMDLCHIAETCKRFRSITRSVIGKTLSFFASDSTFKFFSSKFNPVNVTRSDIEIFFRNFGCCINKGFFGSINHQLQCYALNLVKDHCDEALTLLQFHDLQTPAILTQEMKPAFQRLHTLTLSSISIDGNQSIFSELNSLIELNVEEAQNYHIVLENVFPQLKRFSYVVCKEICEPHQENLLLERLQAFVTSHPCLEFLKISLKCDQKWWTNILETIASSCAELQELDVKNMSRCNLDINLALRPLQTLKSLETLNLRALIIEDFEVFAPMTGLRELHLVRCCLPTDADQFACLSQVTKLYLIHCDSSGSFDVCDIIQQLVNLVKFKLVNVYINEAKCILDAARFSNIINIVKKRPDVLTLTCRCDPTVKREKGQNVKLIRLSRNVNL